MPDITAQAPDGTKHVFPDGTDPAVIDRTMKQYITGGNAAPAMGPGSFQQRPGGPVLNANTIATSGSKFEQENARPTATRALNEFTLGTTSALSGLPESQSPIGDAIKSLVSPPKSIQEVLSNPLLTGGVPAVRGTEQVYNILKQLFSPSGETTDPTAERAHALGTVAGTAGQFGIGKDTMESPGGGVRRGMQEVLGEGRTKATMLADQHAHALATQQHIAQLASDVHTDAQQAMSQVLAKVDEAHPEGAFSRADIQSKVSDAVGDLVKVPEKMPSSVTKILGDNSKVSVKRGAAGDIQEILDMGGGTVIKDELSAEQLKQMRSDVGMELAKYSNKGVVGAALKRVYGLLSDELRGAARDAGVEKDWLTANSKYNQYASDFLRGPMKNVLANKTAAGIMSPLVGETRINLQDVLQKYKDAGFNVDTDTLGEEIKRYGIGKTVNRLSQPTKMDLLMAGFSPKALAIRQLGPRLMRNPRALDMVAGDGFDTPTLRPRQVYPNKAAAMKASKEPTPASSSGTPALDKVVAKMQSDIADLERQRAATADPARRAEIENAIWERLNARKRNIGPPQGTPERRK